MVADIGDVVPSFRKLRQIFLSPVPVATRNIVPDLLS